MTDSESKSSMADIPVVTLRDMVVYPHGVQPLFIGTPKSIRALEMAQASDGEKRVLLLAKRDPENADPKIDDLYRVGTTALVLQLIRLPDKTVKILVEGESRAKVTDLHDSEDVFTASVEPVIEPSMTEGEAEALSRSIMEAFEHYVETSKKVSLRC